MNNRRWLNLLTAFLLCTALHGCSSKSRSANFQGSVSDLLGDWIVIADTAGEGHTGKLTLNADGTFTSTYTTKKSTDTVSGTYKIGKIDLGDGDKTTVELYFKTYNGKPAPTQNPLRLLFYRESNILLEPLTVAYTRTGETEKASKIFDRPIYTSPAIEGPNLKTKLVWKVDFLPLNELRREVRVANSTDAGPRIVATDEMGWRIFDSSGKLLESVRHNHLAESELVVGRFDEKPVVVEFGTWGSEIFAYDLHGNQLWAYRAIEAGIDWVAPVYINAGNTGYAISYNGGGGVELLTPDGKRSWHADAFWNAWSVTGLRSNNSSIVVAAGSSNGAQAWDIAGKEIREFAAGEVGAVGSADVDGDGKEELLTLGTTISSGLKLSVLSEDGKLWWSKKANSTESGFLQAPFLSGTFGSLGRLVGVADGGGIALLQPDGSLKGKLKFDQGICSVAVLSRKGKPDAILVRLPDRLECIEFSVQ